MAGSVDSRWAKWRASWGKGPKFNEPALSPKMHFVDGNMQYSQMINSKPSFSKPTGKMWNSK